MKISKILAAASAAALVASMGVTFVSADTTYTPTTIEVNTTKDGEKVDHISVKSWGSQWVKCYDAALKDADLSKLAIHFVVESDGTYNEKDNIAFKLYGVNGDNDLGEVYSGVEGQKSYDFYYSLKDVNIDQYGGFGFNTQAGHRDITLVSADIVNVVEDSTTGGNTVDLSEYKKQTEVTLNGEGKSTSDSNKVRINIKHPWCDDAHKADFNLVDDWSVFAGADAIAVTVDISNVTDAFTAYPCFTNGIENGIGYWEASDNNPAVTVNADGTYTFIVKFPSALEMDANNMFFDIATDLAGTDGEDPAVKMAVKKVLVLNKSEAEPTDPSESTADSTDSTDSDESKVILADSADSKTNSAATSSKAANNASNTNPSTGAAALAAVGVALAGAAVVATKKRK